MVSSSAQLLSPIVLLFNDMYFMIFQLHHSENKLLIHEMIMLTVLYETNMLSWSFVVLAHKQQIDMSLYLSTLSLLSVNQSLLLPLNAGCFLEKQQLLNLVFG